MLAVSFLLSLFADRELSWARLDRAVVVPWTLLFVSVIKRHWHTLPYAAILKSFCFFTIIISPGYLQASGFVGKRASHHSPGSSATWK